MPLREARAVVEVIPTQIGIHSIDVELTGVDPDGTIIERAAFLAFAVEPSTSAPWHAIYTFEAVLVALAALTTLTIVVVRRRRRRTSS